MAHIDIVFDAPPGPTSGRFIEVEDHLGHSVGFGQWVARPDGFWALRLPAYIDPDGGLRPTITPVRRGVDAPPYPQEATAEERRAQPTYAPPAPTVPPLSARAVGAEPELGWAMPHEGHTPVPGSIVTGVIAIEGAPVNGDVTMVYSRRAIQAMDGQMKGRVHVRQRPGGKLEAVYSGPMMGDPELHAKLAQHASPVGCSVSTREPADPRADPTDTRAWGPGPVIRKEE